MHNAYYTVENLCPGKNTWGRNLEDDACAGRLKAALNADSHFYCDVVHLVAEFVFGISLLSGLELRASSYSIYTSYSDFHLRFLINSFKFIWNFHKMYLFRSKLV